MPTAITAAVVSTSGNDELLWMKGIFRVRIMCTINVWERSPSTNHPVWKSDCCTGVFALKTKNSSAKVA